MKIYQKIIKSTINQLLDSVNGFFTPLLPVFVVDAVEEVLFFFSLIP